ncbi:class II fumarate hydratase [Rickettsiales bacterium]|nr:class II fumarate hydratase [Rickettsiales bacterium]
MKKFREESDSLGRIKVPAEKYWGAQTQRSLENFKIGSDLMPLEFLQAFALQKKAAIIANLATEKISENIAVKIMDVCDEIVDGKLNEHFPLSVWQTGSGTQTNMNLNEVIANRANELLGKKLGSHDPVHPNDHCNLGQSSNDSFPTAMNIAIMTESRKKLIPVIKNFIKELSIKEKSFSEIVKIGRTHLQDAVPLTLGQEFGAFRVQIEKALKRIEESSKELFFLAQGATAVGSGLNSSEVFVKGFIKAIQTITGLPFKSSENKFESISSHDSIVNLSGAINTLVIACYKIANDIRLLASGPRCGIGEINLPSNEPGSSIMPGKVNPTQCESLAQVCIYLMGCNNSIGIAGSQGQFQLNANKTVIIFIILRSINLLSDSITSFCKNCLKDITPNLEKIEENVQKSLMLVTALNPKIGYDKSAEIAKKAFNEKINLKEAAVKLNYISEEDFDQIVSPIAMTKNKKY